MVSDQSGKDPAHVANTETVFEEPTIWHYKMYMLEQLDLYCYQDRLRHPVECVILFQACERISVHSLSCLPQQRYDKQHFGLETQSGTTVQDRLHYRSVIICKNHYCCSLYEYPAIFERRTSHLTHYYTREMLKTV